MSHASSLAPPPSGFHADRVARRHRHHRHPDRPAPARRAEGPRGRRTDPVPEQPEAASAWPSTTTTTPTRSSPRPGGRRPAPATRPASGTRGDRHPAVRRAGQPAQALRPQLPLVGGAEPGRGRLPGQDVPVPEHSHADPDHVGRGQADAGPRPPGADLRPAAGPDRLRGDPGRAAGSINPHSRRRSTTPTTGSRSCTATRRTT